MRTPLKIMLRRFALGVFLFIVSLMPLRNALLKIKFIDGNMDFLFVLFAIVLPHIIRTIAMGIVISAMFLFFKVIAMSQGKVEASLYKLRKRRWLKNSFYALVVFVPLIFPVRSGVSLASVSNALMTLPYGLNVVAVPFVLLSYMDVLLAFEAFVVASFFIHILRVLSIKYGSITPVVRNKVLEEGKEAEFLLEAKSPFPLFSFPRMPFKMGSQIDARFLKRGYTVRAAGKLSVGYYRFDVLKFEVATFPFFFSTVYKTTSRPVSITVLPRITAKNVVYTKNPYMIKESGDLVKKVTGSSLEFAGIREFIPGDPPSKVYWKALAKGGELLTKDFFSPAEDRWILMIDASNPYAKSQEVESMLKFSRAFVELFTRKNVEVSIQLIAPTYASINYSSKKKDLLSFIIKHWGEFRHISHEGAREILKDAIGRDYEEIEERCKKSGISMSSFLFYTGLVKKPKKVFHWKRGAIIEQSMLEFTKSLRKSGKILFVTPGMPDKLVDKVRKVARARRCALLFAAPVKIPRARSYIIDKKTPERSVWRLMYA